VKATESANTYLAVSLVARSGLSTCGRGHIGRVIRSSRDSG
jgi:hypothetical protein